VKIAVLREGAPGERRVAATPETVKKFVALGAEVAVEAGAGEAARYPDAAYAEAGASIGTASDALAADVVLCVRRPGDEQIAAMRAGALLVRVTAAPVDGAANEALIRVLGRRLGVAKGALRIVTGRTSKLKVVEIEGLEEAELQRRLSATIAPGGVDLDAD